MSFLYKQQQIKIVTVTSREFFKIQEQEVYVVGSVEVGLTELNDNL